MNSKAFRVLNPYLTSFGYLLACFIIALSLILPIFIIYEVIGLSSKMKVPIKVILVAITASACFLIFGFTLLVLIVIVKRLFNIKSGIVNSHRWSWGFFRFGAYSSLLGLAQFFFLPLVKATFIINLFYKGMGAKIGKNTIIGATKIFDCDLVEIGDNCVIGGDSIINGHMLEGDLLIKGRVKIGNNVTIGTCSMILPGTIIENNVILGASSLVTKNMILEANHMYGGIPAKKLNKMVKKLDNLVDKTQPNLIFESQIQLKNIKENLKHADIIIKLYERLSIEIVAFETLIANVFISSTGILFSIILYGIINNQPKLLLVIAPLVGIASSFFISTSASMLRAAFKKSQIEIFFQSAGVKYFNWETRYGELGKSRLSDLDGMLIFIIYALVWGAGLFLTFNGKIVTKLDLFIGYSIYWILAAINCGIILWVIVCFLFFIIKSKFYKRELHGFRNELLREPTDKGMVADQDLQS